MKRPLETEFAPFYQGYVNQVKGEDIISTLDQQYKDMQTIFSSVDDEKGNYTYAEGKWSIKEMLGHIIDAERIFSYRIVCFARGEQQPLPGFEQDDFVNNAEFNKRSMALFAEEYNHLRLASIAMIKSLSEKDLNKKGIASNNPVTVRALVFILTGHEKHHLNILKERYLI